MGEKRKEGTFNQIKEVINTTGIPISTSANSPTQNVDVNGIFIIALNKTNVTPSTGPNIKPIIIIGNKEKLISKNDGNINGKLNLIKILFSFFCLKTFMVLKD